MDLLQANHPHHFAVMTQAILEIVNRLGEAAELEFWKGGHIVFDDAGAVYRALAGTADPIAKKTAGGAVMNKTDFVGLTGANFNGRFGGAEAAEQQRSGKMIGRRPGTKETSHYKDTTKHPDPENIAPQYGVDMPEVIKGHLLFGLDYDGNTFIQTEGAGFQNFKEASLKHGGGFLTLKIAGWQTGMSGYSKRSEQGEKPSHLAEADNAGQDNITDILNSIV